VVSNCTLCNPYGGKVREFAILSTTLTVDPIGFIWYSKQRVESKKQTNEQEATTHSNTKVPKIG
jgi:hypothetical protein